MVKLGLKIENGRCVLTARELPDISEIKRRWLAGESIEEIGSSSAKPRRKSKMEKRRIARLRSKSSRL